MIRIENRRRGPIQIPVRSKEHLGQLVTLNLPGIGAGKNFYDLEDELVTEFIQRIEKDGFIKTKYINNVNEGE